MSGFLFRMYTIRHGRRSMPRRTCLIVFQTYHTAEPRRSTYAQLAPYNMRKSPLFTKHFVQLISEHDYFVLPRLRLAC